MIKMMKMYAIIDDCNYVLALTNTLGDIMEAQNDVSHYFSDDDDDLYGSGTSETAYICEVYITSKFDEIQALYRQGYEELPTMPAMCYKKLYELEPVLEEDENENMICQGFEIYNV